MQSDHMFHPQEHHLHIIIKMSGHIVASYCTIIYLHKLYHCSLLAGTLVDHQPHWQNELYQDVFHCL